MTFEDIIMSFVATIAWYAIGLFGSYIGRCKFLGDTDLKPMDYAIALLGPSNLIGALICLATK